MRSAELGIGELGVRSWELGIGVWVRGWGSGLGIRGSGVGNLGVGMWGSESGGESYRSCSNDSIASMDTPGFSLNLPGNVLVSCHSTIRFHDSAMLTDIALPWRCSAGCWLCDAESVRELPHPEKRKGTPIAAIEIACRRVTRRIVILLPNNDLS